MYYLKPKKDMFHKRFEERFVIENADAQLPGPEVFASSTLINAKCENISCCTSVAAVFLKKRMTTIYVDSRKRVAGLGSDFEVDLGESLPAERRPAGRLRLHGRTAGHLGQLQLCHRHL